MEKKKLTLMNALSDYITVLYADYASNKIDYIQLVDSVKALTDCHVKIATLDRSNSNSRFKAIKLP